MVKNLSSQTKDDNFRIMLNREYPDPEVEVEGILLNPSKKVGPTLKEKELFYHCPIPASGEKEVTWRLRLLKEPLPYREPDVTLRPALRSELWVKGSPALMNKLHVEVLGLTWQDNWALEDRSRANQAVFLWTTKYPLLPFQGGLITIKRK